MYMHIHIYMCVYIYVTIYVSALKLAKLH